MSSYERITAPRIVQPSILRSTLSAVLFVLVLAAVGWYGYDIGRSAVAPTGDASHGVGQQALLDRIATLETERDRLHDRVLELTTRLEVAKERQTETVTQAVAEESPPVDDVASAENASRGLVETPPAVPVDESGEAVDSRLLIENLQLTRAGGERRYSLEFTVGKSVEDNEQVTGSIWIAVNGEANGKPKRLPFKALSSEGANFVAMRFKQSQVVQSPVVLPEGFTARNLVIDVNPAGDSYAPVSATHSWKPSG